MRDSLPPQKDPGNSAFVAAALIAAMVLTIFVGFDFRRSDMQRERQALHMESRDALPATRNVEQR